MARLIPDGTSKVTWAPTVASKAAPTTSEVITSGIDLTPFITGAGIDTPEEGEVVDASDLSSAFNKNVPGVYGGSASGEFFRDDASDTAWTTLARGTSGNLVISRFGGSGTDNAIASGDSVEVWPVRVSSRSNTRLARNDVLRFVVSFATTDEPALIATVTG